MTEHRSKKQKRDSLDGSCQILSELKRPEYPISNEFLLLLAKMKGKEIPTGKAKIFTCDKTDSLTTVLNTLSKRKIHSLPVLKATKQYYGFIDVLDVVRFVVDLCGEHVIRKVDFDLYALDAWKEAKVTDVMKYPLSIENPFHPMRESQSWLAVVEVLATGIHRVPLLDDNHDLVHLVTQSQVMRFISHHMESLGAKRNMLVRHIENSLQYVVSVATDQRLIDAFRLIKICNIGGVAVVNDKGALCGNVSAFDVKQITSTARWANRLFRPVGEFISDNVVYLHQSDTLENAITKFVLHKIHRIYVVDPDTREPIGLVTLTDVLKEVIRLV